MAAASDGHFEFARQIVELRVAAKLAVDRQGQRRGVTNLAGLETGEGAAGDVASDVAAGARSGEAGFPEGLEDLGQRFAGDPGQLDILAHVDVGAPAGGSFGHMRTGTASRASQ